MALALLLRNAVKLNGTGLTRGAAITPLRTFTGFVAGQQRNAAALALTAKPLSLVKASQPLVRNMSGGHGNHAMLWKAERVLAASLLAVLPTAFLAPSQVADTLLAVALVLHSHWGVEAIVVDYVRPSIVGNVVPKVAHVSIYLFSILALAGLMNLIYNDIGVVNSIKKLWAVNKKEEAAQPKIQDKTKAKK